MGITMASHGDRVLDTTALGFLSFARSDLAKRVVAGRLVTWGERTQLAGGRHWRFHRGSVSWSDPSRVKLNFAHAGGMDDLIGVGLELEADTVGLSGRFRLARTEAADKALQLVRDRVLDGFSVEVSDIETVRDEDPTVTGIASARLVGVALTHVPSIDSARVAAMRDPWAPPVPEFEVALLSDDAHGFSIGPRFRKDAR